ncbi:hypothetical protein QZH41_006989 [Actinostola sp. cb2023]|nr:hypothetical protein QZH41_006989 [Actinostola sp. cb2023]
MFLHCHGNQDLAMSFTNVSSNVTANPNVYSKEQACAAPIQFENIFHTAFLILILVVTFAGNVLVILAVIFFRRLRSITNYFVVSLAVSDLFVAVFSLPFRIDQSVHNAQWCLGREACITWIIVDTTCSFASIWNLAVISIDRYIAITHPFRYHSLITTTVGYGLICFVWGFSFFLALMSLINWTDFGLPHILIVGECQNYDPVFYTASAAMSFYLPLSIILVMYGFVFRVALNQARAMAALQIDAKRHGGRRSSINLIREVKAAKTLAIVVGCFVVCWFPFSVLIHINLWKRELLDPPALTRSELVGLSLTFVYVLPAINSTMNPIIYALFNRDFRSAFWKLTKRLTGRRLGAVGFGGEGTVMDSTNTVHHNSNGPARGIRFKGHESESSETPLPTFTIRDHKSYNNDAYNEQSKTTDNNLNITHDTRSLETTLDDDKKAKEDCTDASGHNGCVNNDVGGVPKVDMSVKLPPLERNSSTHDSVESNGSTTPKIVRPYTLPPIELNNSNHDGADPVSVEQTAKKLDNSVSSNLDNESEVPERNSDNSEHRVENDSPVIV